MKKPIILELKEKSQRNMITAYVMNTTAPKGVQTLLSLREQCKIGSKLSIEGGKIKVGSGVSKILISAKALIDTSELTNNFLYLLHNDMVINRANGYGIYETLSLPCFLVNVKEGDRFAMSVLTGTVANVYEGSYMTIEVVELEE